MTDITIDLGETRVNLRASALIMHNDRFLVCRVPTEDWYFLPGGRIKTNESSRQAVEREITEEIGADFRILRPIVYVENFFRLHAVNFHEFCIFYLAEWFADPQTIQMNASEEVRWIPRKEAEAIDLRPVLIKKHILEIPDTFQMVISREHERPIGPDQIT